MKLCECGCGQETRLAPQTHKKLRWVKGQGIRFISGHGGNHHGGPTSSTKYRQKHNQERGGPNGTVTEHVLLAEAAIGRRLPVGAEIHHFDGDTKNNKPGNLIICQDSAYHALIHVRQRVSDAGGDPNTQKICSTCKAVKLLADFNRMRANVSRGLQSACRGCQQVRDKKRRECRHEIERIERAS